MVGGLDMSQRVKYLALIAGMAMMPQSKNLFDTRIRYSNPAPQHTDLPRWKIGEHIIHAKDAKTAEKYAKKRGLWKEGYKVEKKEE